MRIPRLVGVSNHGEYGDTVTEVDEGVGRIISAIREVGEESNTLVYFTSDHGGDQPQLGQRGGYNGIFRGGKGNGALEGGMRVPGILKVSERDRKIFLENLKQTFSGQREYPGAQ